MRRFAGLYAALDRATSTPDKVAALAAYFAAAPPADAAWAVHFLIGRRIERLVPVRQLAGWAMEAAGLPDWLFEECYKAVGDLAETAALLVGSPDPAFPAASVIPGSAVPLAVWAGERLVPLGGLPPEEQRARVLGWWRELTGWEVFVLNKLLTGVLRVGVSRSLVERALAQAADLPADLVAHRLEGAWEPSAAFFQGLVAPASADPLAAAVIEAPGEVGGSSAEEAPSPDPLLARLDGAAEPYRIDAVLTYAQPGQGRRGNLLSAYTFGVWSGGRLVTLAKAESGLSDQETLALDRWIRRHTTERFGPVRAVEPVQVFELAFQGIARSARHRSGVAVRLPRVARWRTDKKPEDAATLDSVQALLEEGAGPES